MRKTASRSVPKMLLLLSDDSDIYNLTAEQLKYIPKIILLRQFSNYIGYVWDKLPEDIRADPEIQQYHRCLEHYNLPHHQTHIDGPPPLIKNCGECQLLQRRRTNA